MTFTDSSREQWVRLEGVGVGDTRLVISAERDFTWAHETRRHWSPEWPVTVEHAGICGRTKAVRDAIVGMIPGVSHCRDVTPEHSWRPSPAGCTWTTSAAACRHFAGSAKGIEQPEGIAGDFDGLTSLKRLRMYRNSLTTLPAGIFDDLAGLMTLDLDNNQLTTLRPGVFDQSHKSEYTVSANDNNFHRCRISCSRTIWRWRHIIWNATPAPRSGRRRMPAPIRRSPPALRSPFQARPPGPGPKATLPGAGSRWTARTRPRSSQGGRAAGPRSNAPTFTAPAAPTVMHFRLTATPKVLIETRPNSSGGTSNTSRRRGILDGFAWVTITVGGGQGSPQQNEDAQPASGRDTLLRLCRTHGRSPAGCERDLPSPDHVERWSRVLAAFGEENSYSNNPMTIPRRRRRPIAASSAGLRWRRRSNAWPARRRRHRSKKRKRRSHPPPRSSASRPGSAITEGGNASFTITADPAPPSDITIAYTVAQSGDFLDAPGAGARTATLAAGATSTTLTVATVDDAADEADGSVTVTLDTATATASLPARAAVPSPLPTMTPRW